MSTNHIEGLKVGPLVLGPTQIPHFNNLCSYLQRSLFCVDTSETGAGKSYVSSAIAIHYSFRHVIIVCPATAKSVWKEMISKCNLPVVLLSTYESLSSKKDCQPKHGFLKRFDVEDKVSFTATEKYLQYINEGVLVIFDEFQKIKNESSNMYKSVKALIHPFIITEQTISRMILISATPFDKPEHPLNMLKCVGVVRSHRMFTFHKETSYLELQGAQELYDYCKKFDPVETNKVIYEYPWDKKNIDKTCYMLYIRVLQKHITSSMPKPKKTFNKNVFNGYYILRDSDKELYIKGIQALHSALRYNSEKGNVNLKNMNLGNVTKACMMLDKAKTYSVYRAAKWVLENVPNSKVILSGNYLFSIKTWEENLKMYNPIVFTGETNESKRAAYRAEFQEYNLNRRVFISTLKTGSISVSLDDTSPDGKFPRYCFGLPSYMVMDIQQWTGRVYRYATTSQPSISLVYGLIDDKPELPKEADMTTAFVKETSIANALSRGGTVFEQTLEGQVKDGAIFPNKYPIMIEQKNKKVDYPYIEIKENVKVEEIEINNTNKNIIINNDKVDIIPFSELHDDDE
jgi:hypothetical protein